MTQNANRQAGRKGIAISTPLGIDTLPGGVKRLQLCTSEWRRSRMMLAAPHGHNTREVFCDGKPITEARNEVAQMCFDDGLRYLFFLDSDILTPPQTLARLTYILDNNPDVGIAAGLYTFRADPAEPMIWTEWDNGVNYDWTVGDIVDVCGTAGGCMLIRMEALEQLPTNEKPWFQMTTGRVSEGEDIYFCRRMKEEAGYRIVVDTSLNCGHIDAATGRIYSLGKDSAPYQRFLQKRKEQAA